jgi:hypothetical protein
MKIARLRIIDPRPAMISRAEAARLKRVPCISGIVVCVPNHASRGFKPAL